MNSRELPHLWANKSNDFEKTIGNISCHNGGFYSYATCIARRFHHPKLGAFYVINDSCYSTTTAKHQHGVRMALCGHPEPIFFVGSITRGSSLFQNYTMEEIGKALLEWRKRVLKANISWLAKSKSKAAYYRSLVVMAMGKLNKIQAFFFPRRKPIYKEADFLGDSIDRMVAKQLKETKGETAKRLKAQAEREKSMLAQSLKAKLQREQDLREAQPKLEDWMYRKGETFGIFSEMPIVCRTRANKTLIETSNGAVIPYEAGRTAWAVWDGKTTLTGNEQIGDFKIASVTPEYLRVGCTTILKSEIERFAKQEGWV